MKIVPAGAEMPVAGWILLGVFLLLLLYVVLTHNRLVRYRVEVANSWSQIDVQLKRRHELIPRLVETVRGIMKFERETLTKVVEARACAAAASGFPERVRAEGEVSGLLGHLMAVWENYPDLKSNRNAVELQEQLATTEDRIAYTRGYYNDIVANYNTLLGQFPSSVVARLFGFRRRGFFEVPGDEKRPSGVRL